MIQVIINGWSISWGVRFLFDIGIVFVCLVALMGSLIDLDEIPKKTWKLHTEIIGWLVALSLAIRIIVMQWPG